MTRYGSDVIVDLLIEAGIDHVAFNPGASFRGIHDSLAQTPRAPRIVLCPHEAIAVAVAHGYTKASGKPMAALLHDVVGLQNGSMAVYNAWCDRAPVLLVGGTGPKSKATRRPWIDWIHTASVQAQLVRDYVKWDDEPHDLASVPESFARGLASATSAPPGPVYLCYDADLQEQAIPPGQEVEGIGRYPVPTAPAAGRAQLELLAAALRRARRPAILAGYAGETPEALEALTRLAETIGAPVVDTGVRFAFPTDHPLAATGVDGVLEASDVVLTLDVDDLRGPFGDRLGNGSERGSVEVLAVGLSQLRLRGWSHDYQPLAPVPSLVTAAADETVAALLPLLETEPPDRDAVQARLGTTREALRAARAEQRRTASRAEAEGAIPLERLVHEVGVALQGRDFVLGNGTNRRLEHTLWSMSKARQYIGWHGGGGLGYGLGAAIGAALARPGTISVDIQPDGDLLYLPSALWTAAHLGLPVLIVVHNNRQYANSVEHAAAIAADRSRDRASVGTRLDDPPVDFAALAAAYGVWSAGPIAEPATLADRLADAVAIVAAGRPALLDVLVPGS